MSPILLMVLIVIFVVATISGGLVLVLFRYTRLPPPGRALVIRRTNGALDVRFDRALVLPIHEAKLIDTTVQTVDVQAAGFPLPDGGEVTVDMRFFLRVNPTPEDIAKVATAVGAERATSAETLEQLFAPKFLEALKSALAAGKLETEALKEHVFLQVGMDLNGYVLEDGTVLDMVINRGRSQG